MHFGNLTGINTLKGKDIGIVGTPYKVEEAYKLVACYFGADVNKGQDRCPRYRRVEYEGCRFLIVTYEEPLLQEVQLYFLKSELEQAVGRARALRFDCTVYVFSAFPCEQAELRTGNYLISSTEDEGSTEEDGNPGAEKREGIRMAGELPCGCY